MRFTGMISAFLEPSSGGGRWLDCISSWGKDCSANLGRNSGIAIAKQIASKFKSGKIQTITATTAVKMAGGASAEATGAAVSGAVASDASERFEDNFKQAQCEATRNGC